jgi:hypothetical protein
MIRAADLDTWVGLNIRQFCAEGIGGRPDERVRRFEDRSRIRRAYAPGTGVPSRPRLHSIVLDSTNQCAHFVSHVLDFYDHNVPMSHTNVRAILRRCNSSLRLFPATIERTPHPVEPGRTIAQLQGNSQSQVVYPQVSGLIYMTRSDHPLNDAANTWTHIGFYVNGWVWHYENHSSVEKIVKQRIDQEIIINSHTCRYLNRYTCWEGRDETTSGGPSLWLTDLPPRRSRSSNSQPYRTHTFREYRSRIETGELSYLQRRRRQ